MSSDTTSDDEGSQEDPPRYDIDELEIIKTIGKPENVILIRDNWFKLSFNYYLI